MTAAAAEDVITLRLVLLCCWGGDGGGGVAAVSCGYCFLTMLVLVVAMATTIKERCRHSQSMDAADGGLDR